MANKLKIAAIAKSLITDSRKAGLLVAILSNALFNIQQRLALSQRLAGADEGDMTNGGAAAA